MTRVLYVINSLGQGGAEQSLAEMLPLLQDRGVEALLFILREAEHAQRDELDGITQVVPPRRGTAAAVSTLRRAIKQFRPSLIHTSLFESDVLGRVTAIGSGIPVLTSLVNTAYDPVRLKDPRVNPAVLRLYQGVDIVTSRFLTAHFHALTAAVKQAAVTTMLIPEERITVIERGRGLERLGTRTAERRRRVRAQLGVGESSFMLLNVGRQEFQKNQSMLLKVFAKLLPRKPHARLFIAGRSGNCSEELARLSAQLGLGDKATFLGFRSDVPDLLAAADLFVFPSLYEGLGGSAIEALALGCPIVAAKIPALEEVLDGGKYGELANPEDEQALIQAIERLMDDPERRARLRADGIERFHQCYTLERSVDRMKLLYDAVQAGGARNLQV